MILKVLTFGAIGLLVVSRLARTRFGSRLLGVSLRVLNIVYLDALVIAGILAVVFEQWILLVVVAVLACGQPGRGDPSALGGPGRAHQPALTSTRVVTGVGFWKRSRTGQWASTAARSSS
ncbi:hypothetical protein [Brachybacterium sp. GPGPB12]|uniref:hypothetical protein n=1 Tax=Brachybacterium sp. GPGPB12 TaxID=3023517 RepID=UPI00313441DB